MVLVLALRQPHYLFTWLNVRDADGAASMVESKLPITFPRLATISSANMFCQLLELFLVESSVDITYLLLQLQHLLVGQGLISWLACESFLRQHSHALIHSQRQHHRA
jgi:hypothetical protein